MSARSKGTKRKRSGSPYVNSWVFRMWYQKRMLEMPLHQLAAATGIAPRRLVAFGNGSARPTLPQLERIQNALRGVF